MTSPFDSPFDSETGAFLVLANEEDQRSLWPAAVPPPAGWTAVYGPAGRAECLEQVRASWTDLRPRSLVLHTLRSSGRGSER